jgi:pectate lyase
MRFPLGPCLAVTSLLIGACGEDGGAEPSAKGIGGTEATSGGTSGTAGSGVTAAAGANVGGRPPGVAGAGGGTSSSGGPSGGAGPGGGAAGNGGSGVNTAGSPGDDSDCKIPPTANTPIGYGKGATGGGDATPVVVSSFAEAEAVLEAYRDAFKDGSQTRLAIHYSGKFDFASITDVCAQHTKDAQILQIKEMENVTFQGTSGSSANFGIKVNRAKNVIIRNMTLGLLPGGGSSDAITLEGNDTNGDVEHVWVDHNELFSSTKDDCEGAGDTEFDGLIDIKKGARNITISYNLLHDHQKTGLLGSSDDDKTDRYVTFHHNWYSKVASRTPLHRFGFVHLFNNYYSQISSSGINVRTGGVALVEANHFENVANPITSRYSAEVGYWDLRGNFASGVTWTVEEDTLANADDWTTTKPFPTSELTYPYTPDPVACVKKIVMAGAGAKL